MVMTISLEGIKYWINGMQADWMCCLVNTSEGKPHMNKSLVMIPMDAKGVERSRKLHKLGMWASDTAQIFLDDVRVPQRYPDLEEKVLVLCYRWHQFQEERLWGAANTLKGMEAVFGIPLIIRHSVLLLSNPFWTTKLFIIA